MSRIARKGVTYDARTGFQVKGAKLREDGERRGLWTTEPDELHPQRFVRPPGPDNINWRPGIPEPHGIPVTIMMRSDEVFRPISCAYDGAFTVETS